MFPSCVPFAHWPHWCLWGASGPNLRLCHTVAMWPLLRQGPPVAHMGPWGAWADYVLRCVHSGAILANVSDMAHGARIGAWPYVNVQ